MADRNLRPDSGNDLVIEDAGSTDRLRITDGGSTILYEDGGAAALTIDTSGNTEIAQNIEQADGKNIQTDEIRARDGDGLKLYDDGGNGIFVEDGGQVGISTTSPANDLEIGAYSGDKTLCLTSGTNGNTYIRMNDGDSSEGMFIKTTGAASQGATSMAFGVRWGSDAAKITLFGDGKTGIGTDSPTGTLEAKGSIDQTLRVHCDTTSNVQAVVVKHGRANTASASMIVFQDAAGGDSGIITSDGSSTNYGTSSDYRKKENVIPLTGAIDRLNQLKPSRFNFIGHPDKTVDGFLAHEAQEVVPESVIGEKDAMKSEVLYDADDELPDGKSIGDIKTPSVPDMQMMDISYLVPLVVGALQEAITRIETLENA